MPEVFNPAASVGDFPNALVFGRRLRHLRSVRGMTLRELGSLVSKGAPYLSQVETGKREPTLTMITVLAEALDVTPTELLSAEPPSRRAELEIQLEQAQRDPLWSRDLELPSLNPSKRVPNNVLEAIVRLFQELKDRGQVRAETPEGARRTNATLRQQMRERDNYFSEIEKVAARALDAVQYPGGPTSQRSLEALASYFGFSIHSVSNLPRSVRSLTDKRHKRIYIPQRNQVGAPAARSIIVQTLGHFALEHEDPRDFGDFLRERIEANYFAGAILLPERAVVPFLREAKEQGDVAIEDLEERFYVSYEMAAHRFANLATHHLGVPVHFARSDEEGVIWKAYENDDIPFPTDPDGAIEGQLLCRHWAARQIFRSSQKFSTYYQRTDTPRGQYWSSTYLDAARGRHHAITVGTQSRHSRHFRGSATPNVALSRCPNGSCCRLPPPELAARWSSVAWPSPRPHSHVLAALPAGSFPGLDLWDIYEFLDSNEPV
jgi:XRE family transcriptional regulator, fatty acid utilization regulator